MIRFKSINDREEIIPGRDDPGSLKRRGRLEISPDDSLVQLTKIDHEKDVTIFLHHHKKRMYPFSRFCYFTDDVGGI